MDQLQEWLTQPEGLATRLKALRVQAELSGKDLANAHGWQQSKVSKIETGKQMPSADDIRAWAEACGADAQVADELLELRREIQTIHKTFQSSMRQGQKGVQERYNRLVEESRLVRHFETVFIPGMLQVPGYAHRVLTEMKNLHGAIDDVDEAVSARMRRQQELYTPDKRFEFLLAEPVLRWLICPPTVMRSQLDRLQTVIGLERVRFGILPMGVELATTPQNSFQVYVADESMVMVETFLGEAQHLGESAEKYEQALDLMWDEAVTGEQAREIIIRAIRELP